jgi:protein TonB
MAFVDGDRRERAASAAAVLLVHLLIGYALLSGLRIAGGPRLPSPELVVLDIAPPPPPPRQPRVVPRRVTQKKAGGGSAPPALRARPTEIVLPPPIVPVAPPPPIAVAETPGPGAASSRGDAPVPGPGEGSGGRGNGRGGGDGDGEGFGSGGGGLSPPRHIRGRIRDSDYPRGAGTAGIGGVVEVRYRVEVDGRATRCAIERSSGSPELDATTCRLIEARFRFEPSRDDLRRPVPSWIVQRHEWVVETLPPEPDARR